MARLPYLDASDLAPADRPLLSRPIALHRVLVHSPGMAAAFGTMGQYIRRSTVLDPRLRELAILQMGWCARSPYEWSHHIKVGRDFGVTDDDLRALIADSNNEPNGLGPAERAVLAAARHLSRETELPDPLFEAVRAHLDEAALLELFVVIGFYAGVVRVLGALRIDVEPEYQPLLDAFPLPG